MLDKDSVMQISVIRWNVGKQVTCPSQSTLGSCIKASDVLLIRNRSITLSWFSVLILSPCVVSWIEKNETLQMSAVYTLAHNTRWHYYSYEKRRGTSLFPESSDQSSRYTVFGVRI